MTKLNDQNKKILKNKGHYLALGWGLTVEELFERYGNKITISDGPHGFNMLIHIEGPTWQKMILQNFPNDCGALIATGVNNADNNTLSIAEDIASRCGFSKIFATIVKENVTKEDVKAMIAGTSWKIVSEGNSNRSSYKKSFVLLCNIKECIWKGYSNHG